MERFSRRTVIVGGGAVTTAGTIAESATPGFQQPLPVPVAGDPDVTVAVYESVSDAIDSARAG